MASELRVNTLKDASGNNSIATSYVANGSAKVWVNFNGTASGAAARDSFGVSSMDDNGTGDYDVNLSSAMSDANYAVVVGQGRYNEGSYSGQYEISVATVATTSLQVFSNTTASAKADYSYNAVAFLGDLA
jgi:hypothetical protein